MEPVFDVFVKAGWQQIAKGAYGAVFGSKDSKWIVKRAQNDGTRTFLEWCMVKRARGERMKGMPEIDFLVPQSALVYLVAMKRYTKIVGKLQQYGWKDGERMFDLDVQEGCPVYLKKLIEAFEADNPNTLANDVHHGNIMYDEHRKELILTDPSSSGYVPVGTPVVDYWSNKPPAKTEELLGMTLYDQAVQQPRVHRFDKLHQPNAS